ncbi:hypothetical protein INT46_000001 [Mucor plumbeus]|uniref:Uncharacterized protein n=1 Tax=Mucor plumbeus TaxID=97098 RepID=A0A8H7UKM7_9FUNG|nr:hypothetical protein INT46_000001 [Mucor plumbeus]
MTPVEIPKTNIWEALNQQQAPISMAQWITVDKQAGDTVLAGIRYSRRRKKLPLPINQAEIESLLEEEESSDNSSEEAYYTTDTDEYTHYGRPDVLRAHPCSQMRLSIGS